MKANTSKLAIERRNNLSEKVWVEHPRREGESQIPTRKERR